MKINMALLFVLLVNISILAQVKEKYYELSFSGTIGAVKSSLETSGNFNYKSEGEFSYYILSETRLGYFLNKNFEIEPELQFTIFEGVDPSYSINANILYNFNTDSSKAIPFFLIGYGIGNSVPFFDVLLSMNNKSLFVHQLNAGFGTKIFVTGNVAMRIEYRFQLYKYKEELGNDFNPPVIHKYSYYIHNLLFGISLFL